MSDLIRRRQVAHEQRWESAGPSSCPQSDAPKGSGAGRGEVERLHTLVAEEAEALPAAITALDEAEKADVEALATAFRSGSTAKPQTPKIEQAACAVREHERRVEAAARRIAAAEADVGVGLHAQREAWLDAVEREVDKERAAVSCSSRRAAERTCRSSRRCAASPSGSAARTWRRRHVRAASAARPARRASRRTAKRQTPR